MYFHIYIFKKNQYNLTTFWNVKVKYYYLNSLILEFLFLLYFHFNLESIQRIKLFSVQAKQERHAIDSPLRRSAPALFLSFLFSFPFALLLSSLFSFLFRIILYTVFRFFVLYSKPIFCSSPAIRFSISSFTSPSPITISTS